MNDNDKRMIELFARREGYMYMHDLSCWADNKLNSSGGKDIVDPPNYLEDDSAILRIVRGLSDRECIKYWRALHEATRPKGMSVLSMSINKPMIQATTREMAEALYVALGGER